MRDSMFFFREVLRRKPLYIRLLLTFSVLFLITFIFVTPSRWGWFPSDLNASISIWASLFASFVAGILVVVFVEAISLEKELGPMKKLWPFIDDLINDPFRKVKITVAALRVDPPGGDKAPGSGEAMAISHIMRLLMELEMSKAQIELSYAKDNGDEDLKEFRSNPIDRIVLGGPRYCKVTKSFLKSASSVVQFVEEESDQWSIDFLDGKLRRTPRSDAGQGVDYGLILWWHEPQGGGRWWIVLAGLGTNGVIAAGEAITTKRYVKQILEHPILKDAKVDCSNLAVLVKCTYRDEFIVDNLEVKSVFRFA